MASQAPVMPTKDPKRKNSRHRVSKLHHGFLGDFLGKTTASNFRTFTPSTTDSMEFSKVFSSR
ncbi:hypothetical protein SAY86_030902 [Trapa natans]|uniref:Uncharacterized protein n=1 Tax=Trapa natans TaxID=22666 RepID=A0AAN7MP14_TRANT|nr:hypothetical protein SAY86_030902 [Trapa natans]